MKLSVIIFCYNQENFIEECLESVFSQRTNFPIEYIIADDASTDNTQKVIMKFVENHKDKNIKLLFRERNLGLCQNYFTALDETEGQYIASISGDDYWINDTKLQTQVDFLENNTEYVICGTHYKMLNNNTKELKYVPLPLKKTFNHQDVVNQNPVIAGTAIFRKKALTLLPNKAKNLGLEDIPMWWYFSTIGKIKYLSIETLAYRKHEYNVYISKDWAWMRALSISIKNTLNNMTHSISSKEFINQDKHKFIHVLTSNLPHNEKKEILEIFLFHRQKFNFFLKFAFNVLSNKLFVVYFKIAYRLMRN